MPKLKFKEKMTFEAIFWKFLPPGMSKYAQMAIKLFQLLKLIQIRIIYES